MNKKFLEDLDFFARSISTKVLQALVVQVFMHKVLLKIAVPITVYVKVVWTTFLAELLHEVRIMLANDEIVEVEKTVAADHNEQIAMCAVVAVTIVKTQD